MMDGYAVLVIDKEHPISLDGAVVELTETEIPGLLHAEIRIPAGQDQDVVFD